MLFQNGNQKALADYYGSELQVTVFKMARHGGQGVANKPIYVDSHKPKAIFVSSDINGVNPSCNVIDRLINVVQTLCKPEEMSTTSSFYCGEHPNGNVTLSDKLQMVWVDWVLFYFFICKHVRSMAQWLKKSINLRKGNLKATQMSF